MIVGYPRYVPQVLDMVTMDEALHDLFLRNLASDTSLYGQLGTFENPEDIDFHNEAQLRQWRASGRLTWNTEFKPLFYRDIWPILYRPDQFRFLCEFSPSRTSPTTRSSAASSILPSCRLCPEPEGKGEAATQMRPRRRRQQPDRITDFRASHPRPGDGQAEEALHDQY